MKTPTVVTDLLTDIVTRGLDPKRRRLFIIDGSKALHAAINEVFGNKNPIQRCRNHKIRNVLDYLPKDRQQDVRSAMKAAFQLPADRGITKLKKLAQWLEHEYPSAATSLLEGLDEMFTINRLDLPGDAASLSGDDEHHRVAQRRYPPTHRPCHSLA